MPNYKSMYFQLAARVADAVELLTLAQHKGEDAYIESNDEPVLTLFPNVQKEKENGSVQSDNIE
jgi:hypothetical protein